MAKKQNQQLKDRMEDYQALDRSNKELKEENKKLGETV
jgi:cell shape-determining protein MreC